MSVSCTEPLSAWPMCSAPVTFGGGIAIAKFSSAVPSGTGCTSPLSSHRLRMRGSTSDGAKRVRSCRLGMDPEVYAGSNPPSAAAHAPAALVRDGPDTAREAGDLQAAQQLARLVALVGRQAARVALGLAHEVAGAATVDRVQRAPVLAGGHEHLEGE